MAGWDREPWWRWLDLALPLLLLAGFVTVDSLLPPSVILATGFSIAGLVAAAISTVPRTAFVAALAVVCAGVSGLWNHNIGSPAWWVRLGLTTGFGVMAVILARVRVGREEALKAMTAIAEASQRILLRALPSSVRSLRLASRYVSATREALVGGDLYEVIDTPAGVRAIVGDVRGKGLDAVQLAFTVLGAFRHAAVRQESLENLAGELDKVVSAVAGDEDFVTAMLVEFHDDGTATVVNCGHCAPILLLDDSTTRELSPTDTQPPLGLGPRPHAETVQVPVGARVLLFTDGLIEARDAHGAFFPFDAYVDQLRQGSLDEALDRLLTRVRNHTDGRLADDMALVLVEQVGARACEPGSNSSTHSGLVHTGDEPAR
ncbi:PP2C family protein-serine/threonine phosphatase [Terrabacter sp. NPDC080008]|uniref:PP2C family protein-serine/threonine phosphatase n=1 Tax=Terrabacter sp. NPDC080008 TaxID=3155176 RepID=UPI003450375C